jgi:hypothetical protein
LKVADVLVEVDFGVGGAEPHSGVRGVVEDCARSLDSFHDVLHPLQVPDGDLDPWVALVAGQVIERGAAQVVEDPHPEPLADQPVHDVAPYEAGAARDQDPLHKIRLLPSTCLNSLSHHRNPPSSQRAPLRVLSS